jgi:biopolymer transport protein ExbD
VSGPRKNVFGQRHGGGGGGGGGGGVSLNLTALMDILSNLLFFLLASYSAQSVEVANTGLKLPPSTSGLALSPQLSITVTDSRIDVSGVPVAKIEHGLLVGEVDDQGKIPALYERLHNVKVSREGAGRADIADADLVLLLADKGTDSKTIASVLKTAGHAGFYSIRFGVVSR